MCYNQWLTLNQNLGGNLDAHGTGCLEKLFFTNFCNIGEEIQLNFFMINKK